jgi:hypothetical protein
MPLLASSSVQSLNRRYAGTDPTVLGPEGLFKDIVKNSLRGGSSDARLEHVFGHLKFGEFFSSNSSRGYNSLWTSKRSAGADYVPLQYRHSTSSVKKKQLAMATSLRSSAQDKARTLDSMDLLENFSGQRKYTSTLSSFASRGISSVRRMLHGFGSPSSVQMIKRIGALLQEGGGKGLGKGIGKAVHADEWITVGDSRWLMLKSIGKGGQGEAFLVASEGGGQLGVLKRLHTGAEEQGRAFPNQLFRGARGQTQTPEFIEAYSEYAGMSGIGQSKAIELAMRDVRAPNVSESELHFLDQYIKTTPAQNQTSQEMLRSEVELTKAAHVANPAAIPRVLAESENEFVQEFGGMSMHFMRKHGQIPAEAERHIAKQIEKHVDSVFDKGGVAPWDINSRNVVINPNTWEAKIIDQGASSYLPPAISQDHKTYAKEFGQTIMNRLFSDSTLSSMNTLRVADQAVSNSTMSAGSVGKAALRAEETWDFDKMLVRTKNAANVRSHKMADAQVSATAAMFKSPTGHTKGGS